MLTVATFGGPEALVSKKRTPGRITAPVPRGENAGPSAGAAATATGRAARWTLLPIIVAAILRILPQHHAQHEERGYRCDAQARGPLGLVARSVLRLAPLGLLRLGRGRRCGFARLGRARRQKALGLGESVHILRHSVGLKRPTGGNRRHGNPHCAAALGATPGLAGKLVVYRRRSSTVGTLKADGHGATRAFTRPYSISRISPVSETRTSRILPSAGFLPRIS